MIDAWRAQCYGSVPQNDRRAQWRAVRFEDRGAPDGIEPLSGFLVRLWEPDSTRFAVIDGGGPQSHIGTE